jgi:hypothetical protein
LQSTAQILEYYEEVLDIDKKRQKEKEYKNSKEYKKLQREKTQRRKKINFIIMFGVSLFTVTSLSMLFLIMKVKSTTLDEEIKMLEQQIEIAEAETVRLSAERDAMFNGFELIQYAEKNLGMVKAEPYQIQYINLSEGDEIVISGDKEPKQNKRGN